MTTAEARQQRFQQLLQMREDAAIAMLALRPRIAIRTTREPESGDLVEVVACCARELEWIRSPDALVEQPPRRMDSLEPMTPTLWAEVSASVVTVLSNQRYFIAAEPSGTRAVFPVIAVKAERVPYDLKFRNITTAWSHREPTAPATGSAPTRMVRRLRVRSPRR